MSDIKNLEPASVGEIIRKVISEEAAGWTVPSFGLDGTGVSETGLVSFDVRWQIPKESAARISAAIDEMLAPAMAVLDAAIAAAGNPSPAPGEDFVRLP